MLGGFLMDTHCYRNDEERDYLIKEFDNSDLVIWQDIGNFNQKGLRVSGNTNWLKLFKRNNPNTKQIACVHDGNLFNRYPYLYAILPHLDAIVGVHPASYTLGSGLGLPTALIVNPQDMSNVDTSKSNYHNKDKKTIFAMGTWKASKRFQELLAAIPWIDQSANINIAG